MYYLCMILMYVLGYYIVLKGKYTIYMNVYKHWCLIQEARVLTHGRVCARAPCLARPCWPARARTKERAQLRAKPAGAVQHEMQQPSYKYLCTAKIAQCIISQKNLHYFEIEIKNFDFGSRIGDVFSKKQPLVMDIAGTVVSISLIPEIVAQIWFRAKPSCVVQCKMQQQSYNLCISKIALCIILKKNPINSP